MLYKYTQKCKYFYGILFICMRSKPKIISLGGSLIVPNGGIDHHFLRQFKDLIISQVERGGRFIIIVGGGKTSRHYQEAAQKVGKLDKEDVDWLGIHSTHLNAQLVRTILRDHAHLKIITHFDEVEEFQEPIMIAAGWRPGHSTDYDAVLHAKNHGADTVINLSNIDYVFDKDPHKNSDAKPLKEISWADFRKLVGDTWDPGANHPFDPIASKEAQKVGLKVVVMGGKDLDNFKNYLDGKDFEGTVIS